MSEQSGTARRPPQTDTPGESARSRLLSAYRRVDGAVFAFESAVVTLATALMTLFVFFNILFEFANGQTLRIVAHREAGDLMSPSNWLIGGELFPSSVATLCLVGILFAVTSAMPGLAARSLVARAGITALATLVCFAVVWLMVKAHPKWTCLLFTAITAAYAAWWLHVHGKSQGTGARGWAVWATLVIGLTVFSLRVSERFSGWTSETALFLLLWMGFIGASMATSRGQHLRVDAVRKAVPDRFRARYDMLSLGFAAVASAFLCVLAVIYTANRLDAETPAGEIPDWLKVLAIPVSLLLVTARFSMRSVLAGLGHIEQTGPELPEPLDPEAFS